MLFEQPLDLILPLAKAFQFHFSPNAGFRCSTCDPLQIANAGFGELDFGILAR